MFKDCGLGHSLNQIVQNRTHLFRFSLALLTGTHTVLNFLTFPNYQKKRIETNLNTIFSPIPHRRGELKMNIFKIGRRV